MAQSMIRIKKPFDLLVNWDEYVQTVNSVFSQAAEQTVWVPAVDVQEKNGVYLLRIDLPGVSEKDIHVTVKRDRIVIHGTRRPERQDSDDSSYVQERFFGKFQRIITFPQTIEAEKLKREYKNGILKLTIPAGSEKTSR